MTIKAVVHKAEEGESRIYSVPNEEVKRRMREADADPNVLITFDQLLAGLRHRGS